MYLVYELSCKTKHTNVFKIKTSRKTNVGGVGDLALCCARCCMHHDVPQRHLTTA